MLTGDRSKYLGLTFGVTFATLLMMQQVSIFMGILTRAGNQILEVRDALVACGCLMRAIVADITHLPLSEVECASRLHQRQASAK